ncbi:MAG: DEAD/DEAH box helicase, partial [Candidatus Pacearchaeota archaeon]
MNEFDNLGLSSGLVKALADAGITSPTDVQAKAIPLVLEGKDVLGSSATGSGKTIAFGAGIIEKISSGNGIQALILTPTRELAEQIGKNLSRYSKHVGLRVLEIYGGVSIEPQKHALRTADIVVGTPGRVLDHLRNASLDLRKIKFLVLDEADRMLDMGFIDDVRDIVKHCPRDRQTLLFSATISRDIAELSRDYMNSPVKISVESYVDPKKLKQVYYDIYEDKQKFSLLVHLLKSERAGLVMVFCNTQHTTDFIAKNLQKQGIESLAIHGGFSQAKRDAAMEKFQKAKVSVLVCTHVAARGLDIGDVSHVYNYDLPRDPKSYVHRIGRTARAGKEGIAINILGSRDHENFSAVLRNNDVQIERVD